MATRLPPDASGVSVDPILPPATRTLPSASGMTQAPLRACDGEATAFQVRDDGSNLSVRGGDNDCVPVFQVPLSKASAPPSGRGTTGSPTAVLRAPAPDHALVEGSYSTA